MQALSLPQRLALGLALLMLVWWLWAWPHDHLRYYQATTALGWAFGLLTPPLLGWLGWYSTRPGRTRQDFFGALSFVVIGGYGFALAMLAGALHLVNATAATAPAAVVRGTVVDRHVPRRRKRRSRALLPSTITIRLAGTTTEVKLAVPDRADFEQHPPGSTFAVPLRRGALGWWFADKE